MIAARLSDHCGMGTSVCVDFRPKSDARRRMLLLDLVLDNKNENENKKKTLQAVIAIKEKVGPL